jgi:hypothetical protein
MTKNITKVINEKEKMMLETAAHFISICYAPQALKSYMVTKAPSNVLSAIKSAFQIKDHYPVCLPDQGSLPKAQAGAACRHAAPFLEFT